jgi:ubiquinone/menaquinone biosynthesis C-methylase UbiE
MFSSFTPLLRCPRGCSGPLKTEGAGAACLACGAHYPAIGGIVDMTGDVSHDLITPFQRVMQARLIVAIYEHWWRRFGYFLASLRSFDKEMATILNMSHDKDTRLVLDLACGPGVFTRPLAAQSTGIVVGLDLSWPMLRQAQRKLERTNTRNVLLIRGSALRMPFADGAFSYLNCCGALHLFDQPEVALKEMARVLAKDGYLSIQTTIRPSRSAGLAYLLERFIRFGFFEESDLTRKLKDNGLEVLRSERHRISYTLLAGHIS